MKTLYDKLTHEAHTKLHAETEKFPFAIKAIIQELNSTGNVMDLTYGTVISLSNFLNLKGYDIVELLTQFEES